MPCRRTVVAAAAFGLALLGSAGSATATPERSAAAWPANAVPGELIVRFRPGTHSRALAVSGARVVKTLLLPRTELVRVPAGEPLAAALEAFAADPDVQYAETNDELPLRSVIPNDPLFGQEWAFANTGQTVGGISGTPGADIAAPAAWQISTGSPPVLVAVVDTGIAYDAPDIAPNVWTNPGETGGGKETNGRDDDGDGFVDDVHGPDFAGASADPRDFNGHGTAIASLVAARGNDGVGIAGVAWGAKVMALRCALWDFCRADAAINSIVYAVAHGARVVNASWGSGTFKQSLFDAFQAAPNVLFVVAAGNTARNHDQIEDYPCQFALENVVCVTASDQNDNLAAFADYGTKDVDLAAPGTNLVVARPHFAVRFSESFSADIATTWKFGGAGSKWARVCEPAKGICYLDDSPGANTPANANAWAQPVAPVDLTGAVTGCRFLFSLFGELDPADHLYDEASTDGVTWTQVGVTTGSTGGGWQSFADDLGPFQGKGRVFVWFRLVTGPAASKRGYDVDDVGVQCASTAADYTPNDYGFDLGTSFSAPLVAGAAALMWSVNPGASVAQVKDALLRGAAVKPQLAGKTATGGRLDLAASLALIKPPPPPPAPKAKPKKKTKPKPKPKPKPKHR